MYGSHAKLSMQCESPVRNRLNIQYKQVHYVTQQTHYFLDVQQTVLVYDSWCCNLSLFHHYKQHCPQSHVTIDGNIDFLQIKYCLCKPGNIYWILSVPEHISWCSPHIHQLFNSEFYMSVQTATLATLTDCVSCRNIKWKILCFRQKLYKINSFVFQCVILMRSTVQTVRQPLQYGWKMIIERVDSLYCCTE